MEPVVGPVIGSLVVGGLVVDQGWVLRLDLGLDLELNLEWEAWRSTCGRRLGSWEPCGGRLGGGACDWLKAWWYGRKPCSGRLDGEACNWSL